MLGSYEDNSPRKIPEFTLFTQPKDICKLPKQETFTVAVEGNIGCGKSTFLEYFKSSNNVEVRSEPVDLWKNVGGWNSLELMYKDAKRWSLAFQSYVQLTMLQQHHKPQVKPVKMLERSVFSARFCFVENLYRSGCMPAVDHAILEEWYQWILANQTVQLDLIVYLRADPCTCYERLKKRNRQEETGVPLDYLEALHQLHEDWLIHQRLFKVPGHVVVLDANKNLVELQKEMEEKRQEILCGYF
ncbi:thymidine kinase 2, mitochondrial-like [Lingula anatina]|uniref:Thymidine kinase 2, mitochondrial-like n=1 Tax=Lingula anatina TaxID=7574 RepID=A0A1S3JWV6_LINAN|nr:thymidine kinase 2, mitochondrial-like [Lingula anatina]|eukprot:XP_013414541.1 thymidine kinase 2, mitochondrial-like [Lingula anatina]